MAANAPQIQYRQEFIAAFEQRQSLLRNTVTNEAVIKGNQATFLVAGSGSASAVTRGVNGLIPARNDSNTQSTATLVEWHDLVEKTGFNIFESQGDQRRIMQETTRAVLNRKIDSDILTELATGTLTTGTAATASLSMVLRCKTILGNGGIPFDGNVFAAISPAFEAYLLQVPEFQNSQYVNMYPLATGATAWKDQPTAYRWLGITWIVHPNISGAGTASETCFMYHASAIGHAVNTADLTTAIGYDDKQDLSYARASAFVGSKLLQNAGVVKMIHDGSAYVSS